MAGLCFSLFPCPQLLFFILHMNGRSVFSAEKQTCLSQLQNSKLGVGGFLQTGLVIALNVIFFQLIPSPDTRTFLDWLQRQQADEWWASEPWAAGREQ